MSHTKPTAPTPKQQATMERAADPIPDFARSIPMGESSVWKLIKDGKLKPIKIGRRTLIPRTERARFLAELHGSN